MNVYDVQWTDDELRRTPIDGKCSHGLRPGEIKMMCVALYLTINVKENLRGHRSTMDNSEKQVTLYTEDNSEKQVNIVHRGHRTKTNTTQKTKKMSNTGKIYVRGIISRSSI